MQDKEKENKFPTFCVVETDIILDHNLSDSEKILYSFISVLCNNIDKCCYATNSYFSKLMNCDIRTIQVYLASLKKYKYIEIELIDGFKRKIRPVVAKTIYERKELFDYDWLNSKN